MPSPDQGDHIMKTPCIYSLAYASGGEFYEYYLYNENCPSEDEFLKDVSEAITKAIKEKWSELTEEFTVEYELLMLFAQEMEKKGYKIVVPKARVYFGYPGKLQLETNLRKETGTPFEGVETKEIANAELEKYYRKRREQWEQWRKRIREKYLKRNKQNSPS